MESIIEVLPHTSLPPPTPSLSPMCGKVGFWVGELKYVSSLN